MEFPRYLNLLDADLSRIESLSQEHDRDLDTSVPSCPGWLVRDVLIHLAVVYLHKIECIRQLAPPDPWPPEVDRDDPVGVLRSAYDTLHAELDERDPLAPAYSWPGWPQTVGFWYRRMALETVVHRLDVELALGAVTSVPTDLAVDGIDEVLTLMLPGDWPDAPVPGAPYRVDLVPDDEPSAHWVIHVESTRIRANPAAEGAPAEVGTPTAAITGPAAALFGWLWGRGDLTDASVSGAAALVPKLRERLVLATH